MGHDPHWLAAAYDEWKDALAEGVSDYELSKRSGLTRHKCRVLIEYARTLTESDEDGEKVSPDSLLWTSDWEYNPATDRYLTKLRSHPQGLIVTTRDTHEAIISAYSNWSGSPATITEMCRRFGFPRPYMVEYLRRHQITHDHEPFSRQEVEERSVDELAEEAYQRKRHALHQESERIKWQETSADAKRWREFDDTVMAAIRDHIDKAAPEYTVPRLRLPRAEQRFALVCSPTDLHFGMYSWHGETGQTYDMDEAESRLTDHTENILSRLPGQPSRIIVPMGSDWFHCDRQRSATTKGTPVDLCATPTEVLVSGCYMARQYIDRLRQVAPVDVHMMAGNHDQHNSRALLLFLSAWYRQTEGVRVHEDFRARTYTTHGQTLIGFHHGDKTPTRDLGMCMARECRQEWAQTRWHVWFGGHKHHHEVSEIGGITHYMLPSLAAADKWTSESGYVGSDAALVAYIIDTESGPIGWVRSAESGG